MKKTDNRQEHPQNLKRKLMSALAMLLISTILMTTTSYAWFVLSTAPEVTGIETQVGANGSLEIALLNTETRVDMSLIRAGLGSGSLAEDNQNANNAWGNLINLGYTSYGLGQILLLPARLNAVGNPVDGYVVDPGMLAIPTYGYDGRVIKLDDNTLTAVYRSDAFTLVSGVQDYGVRAIGTSNSVSAQESALANAKGNIPTYTKSARTNAQKVLDNHGDAVFNIMLSHMTDANAAYGDEERDALKAMLQDLQKSLSDIDLSLRQGLVAFAASELGDEDTFNAVKDRILDTSKPLTDVLEGLSEVGSVPEDFSNWVTTTAEMQNNLNAAMNACNAMTSGVYTWAEVREVLNYVMNVDYVYIEDSPFAEINQDAIMNKVMSGEEIVMTLAPDSGIFASISDYAGNYSSAMKVMGVATVLIETVSPVNPPHLNALATAVNGLGAASGGGGDAEFALSTTYGYAIDLAFRSNAADPDLVLQTKGVQRVYEESESASTQGGGSYMAFTSNDETLTQEQRLKLMDAIRVAFVDDQGKLLRVGKLNISNYIIEDGMINAPLYLYDYSFSEEDGAMIMGERKLTDNLITDEMNQGVAKAVTVMVWLDGDIVDNSMVSATEATSLSGVLNLQFSTSAELMPAVDGALLNYTADKTGLLAAIENYKATFEAGKNQSENEETTYTNVSWNAFASAYNRAVAVGENQNASAVQIARALKNLVKTATDLTPVSKDAVNEKIDQLREEMGAISGDHGGIVIKNPDGTYSVVGTEEHTQEEHDSWEIVGNIDRVDYSKNMVNEGNDIYTPHYTDATWNALASALYEAEAVAMNPDATDEQINAALTALDNAQKALSRQVFFTPYEYRGSIYYAAICEEENADTYGKWYDSNFKRILSEVTILNLNAYATPAVIVEMGQDLYVASNSGYITPDVGFLEEVFPELRDVEVKGVHWNDLDSDIFTVMMQQHHYARLVELVYIADHDLVLEKIGTSTNPGIHNYGDTQWCPSDVIPEDKTAAGTEWAQVRDEEGYPVRRLICTKEEHAHVNECYSLICQEIVHTHVEGCADETGTIICQFAEHTHGDACYDKETLICPKEVYTHEYACYEYFWEVAGEAVYTAPEYYTTAKTAAKALIAKWEDNQDVPAAAAKKAITDLNNAIVELYATNTELLEEYDNADMTANQRILLTTAANTAKALEDYDSNAALKAATERVEALLASETAPTRAEAAKALVDLNEQLTAVDETAISETNTLTHRIPDGAGSADIVYDVDYPGIKLKLTGKTGTATLSAKVLTTDGVVVGVSKDITVYHRADGVFMRKDNKTVGALSLFDGESGVLTADLSYGSVNMNTIREEVRAYTWASTDMSVISVTANEDGTATFATVGVGTASISVSIDTVAGNAYAYEIPVIVQGIAKPTIDFVSGENSIVELVLNEVGGEEPQTAVVSVDLWYDSQMAPGYAAEEVKSFYFSSSNKSIFTVKNKLDGTATVTAVSPGVAHLNVQVSTVNGSTYEKSIPVYVQCDRISEVVFKLNGESTNELTLEKDETATVMQTDVLYASENFEVKEQIAGYDCYAEDESVATIRSNGDGTFTISAIGPGETVIHVTAVSESGYSIKCSGPWKIIVPESVEAPTEPATEPLTEPATE